MEKRKGVDLLIKGYLKYKESGGTKKLILGGKMQEEDINSLVESAMAKDKDISYLDYVSHDKSMNCMQECQLSYFRQRRRASVCLS